MEATPLTVHVPLELERSECPHCEYIFGVYATLPGPAGCDFEEVSAQVPTYCSACGRNLQGASAWPEMYTRLLADLQRRSEDELGPREREMWHAGAWSMMLNMLTEASPGHAQSESVAFEWYGRAINYLRCWQQELAAPPAPTPPVDITGDLPWNDGSPWPFPKSDITRKRWITLHHSAGERDTTSIGYWNWLHTARKNWPHIGYHFCIAALMAGGEIGCYQTNHIGEITWHDSRNHDTVGVCIAGDLRAGRDDAPTPEQAALTGRLLAWLVPQLPNFKGVIVHKSIQATACPGDVERWGGDIVAAALVYGLDMEGKFNVPLPRSRLGGLSFGLLRKGPPADSYSYEGV